MHRSKKIVIVCHCLLNANAKVYPLAQCGGVYHNVINDHITEDTGIIQLPCPETIYLGMKRWGMTREQYDTPHFRKTCQEMLGPSVTQLKAFADAGYTIEKIIGMDGSPNCGVNRTCYGFTGGEIGTGEIASTQLANLTFAPGRGVFMEILATLLEAEQLSVPFTAIDEEDSHNE